ncbi:probable glycosyltransferase At5g20260 [Nymphaea colorata]|nr:probable glycosyltransferase At5g20260 [Nymphaea colorata]
MREFVLLLLIVLSILAVLFSSSDHNGAPFVNLPLPPSPSRPSATDSPENSMTPVSSPDVNSPTLSPAISPGINSPKGELVVNGEKAGRLEKVEMGLWMSRASIKRAIVSGNYTSQRPQSFVPRGSVYHNPHAFLQSYIEMEKRLKVFVYEEGEPPLVHDGPCTYIYSIEGQFIHELEQGSTPFVTNNPEDAVLYFLPLSISKAVHSLYGPGIREWAPLHRVVSDYVQVISTKHPYWNRTNGADHFMLSCHDWAPFATTINSDLFNRSIRVLCNANVSEGFNPRKDVTLPEFNIMGYSLPNPVHTPTPLSSKTILAFFAGGNHGAIRDILLQHWKGKDSQVQVYEYLPKGKNYTQLLLSSRYCLCPSGYEVASPRIIEAMYTGCVPVTINDYYVLPFSDVLDWSQFSVRIPVSRIPDIKNILSAVPESTYLKLQANVFRVQQHFVINRPAKRFDVINMLLHSVWLRRLNMRLQDS